MTENITMFDYIQEEKDVLLSLLENRHALTGPLSRAIADRRIDEIILCGSGTSYHAGLAARRLIEELTGIRTRAELPMIFTSQQKIYSPHTLFVGISQGGNSLSTVEALDKAQAGGCLCASLSENRCARISRHCDLKLLMDCGPELSIAKTKGYTATMVILWLIGIEAAQTQHRLSDIEAEAVTNRLRQTIDNFPAVISRADAWAEKISQELLEGERILVLGYGHNYANVLEGSLKMLETLRFGIYGYELEEFCHGIYNSIHPDTRLIYLASPGPEKNRIQPIHAVIGKTTAHQFIIGSDQDFLHDPNRDCPLPFIEDPDFHVLEFILPLQILSARLPYLLGIDPFFPSDPQFHTLAGSKAA